MRFGVLGPLEVTRDGESVQLGSFKQRAVLGILLASRNQVVSTDRLIDDLWGDDGTRDRQNALWVHISGLRKALEPGRSDRANQGVLQTRKPGYVLDVTAADLDAAEFERLVAEGRALIDADPAAASIVLAEALALWRGHAYEGFTYEAWAQPEIARLEELRLEAVENRIDADLRRGLARELVGELESLVRLHPTRERLTASLMLALHRSGRQAEALRSYHQLRGRLAEELGVEPSPSIQRLEGQIATNDATLAHGSRSAPAGVAPEPGLSVRGYEIRDRLGERGSGVLYRAFQPSVGREVAIKVIRPELADDPVFIQRFEAEAQLVARLEHPHIVPLYDYWREPGAAYLVMRYMRGGTLRDRLAEGPLVDEALGRMVDQVGAALEAAHLAGVTHGDVAASNVLVDEAGNFYLADFEIATMELVGAASGGPRATIPERAPVADVADLAVTVAQAATGRTDPISDLLVGMDPALAAVLADATSADGSPGYVDAGALRQALATVLRTDERERTPVIDENPYKGLRSFEPSDARDFFGRDRFVERIVARLGRAGVQGRIVAVVGPSGSGKSSVVKAGLLPALRDGAAPGSAHWFAVEMTPGAHPFEALESALRTVAVNPPASLLELLLGERGINRAVDRVLPADNAPLLVVVDQFEELFTHSPPDTTARFLDALVEAVHSDRSRVKFVLTLRADFYDRPLRHRGMGELLRIGTEVLTPMSPDELERAVSGPAERVGARVEPALVGELVAAVVDRPVALPLLQYTLTEVFDRRLGDTLTVSAYRELGGISGALVDRAEALYADLAAEEQRSAQQVFLRMVTLGEGSGDTRRRVLLSELTAMTDVGPFASRVVDTFGRHRLLAFDRDPVTREPTVEISHEALLTTWARLRRWIDDARSDIRAERALAEAAREWVQNGRDPEFVLGTGRLARYSGWRESPPLGLTAEERDLLAASEEADLRRREAQIRQERRDVQLRRRSVFLVGLAAVTAVVVALGAVAVVQKDRASDLADRIQLTAEARRLAREAQLHVREDPEVALMLAVEAARVTAGRGEVVPEAMDALHAGIQAARVQYPVSTADVANRAGVGGGVFLLPPDDLIRLAEDQLSGDLSDAECQAAGLSGCPDPSQPLPAGLAVAGGSDQYSGPPSAQPLAGTQVRVIVPGEAVEREALEANFADFSRQTGIEVIAVAPGDEAYHTASAWLHERTDYADIGIPPHPGMIPELAAGGVMDLSRFLDRPDLEAAWGPYLTSLMTVGPDASWPSASGSVFGLWHNFHAKSVIWYAPAAFEQAGYEVPTTWDELIRLSDRMVADGNTPWCTGLESGEASGWPATDIIEAVLLREEGPDLYDAWVAHEVPFDHASVVAAARRVGELVFTPGYLLEGPGRAARVWYGEGTSQLVADPPHCWMFPMASFARAFLDPSGDPARLGVFDFPKLDSRHADGMVGAGNFAVVLADRPEVRAVVEYMTSPGYGGPAADFEVGFVPPNMDFDASTISNDADRTMAELVQAALASDSFRFDGSDLMPPEVGAGAFWEGMVDWFVEGPESLDGIMAAIEAAWPGTEAADG